MRSSGAMVDGRVAQVHEQHLHLAAVVAVDRPGRVEHRQPRAPRQARARPHLPLEARAGWRTISPVGTRHATERRHDERLGERRVQVHPRGAVRLVARQRHRDGAHAGDTGCAGRAAGPRQHTVAAPARRLDAPPPAGTSWSPWVTYAPARELVLILDFGAQYTQLIARRVREQRVYCEIHPCTLPFEQIRAMAPARHRPLGRPGQRLRRGRAERRPARLRARRPGARHLLRPAAHRAPARRQGRAGDAARVRARARRRREERGHPPPLRQARGARRLDVATATASPRCPPGFQTIGVSGNTPFCAVGNAAAAHLRRAVPPRGRAHAARDATSSPRSSSTSRACAPPGRRARSPRRPWPTVTARVGRGRPRDLRAVGRASTRRSRRCSATRRSATG